MVSKHQNAEATRFELVDRLPDRQFSKLLVSATHPHFLVVYNTFVNSGAKVEFSFELPNS